MLTDLIVLFVIIFVVVFVLGFIGSMIFYLFKLLSLRKKAKKYFEDNNLKNRPKPMFTNIPINYNQLKGGEKNGNKETINAPAISTYKPSISSLSSSVYPDKTALESYREESGERGNEGTIERIKTEVEGIRRGEQPTQESDNLASGGRNDAEGEYLPPRAFEDVTRNERKFKNRFKFHRPSTL